jgi:SulP family sulfate permease
MLVTLILTVFVDLITAVAVGIILATFVSARWLEPEQLKGVVHSDGNGENTFLTEDERSCLDQASGQILVTQLSGSFSYASARTLARRVGQRILGHKVVIYDFSAIGYIDPTAAMAIDDLFEQGIANGQLIFVAGLRSIAERTLDGFGALDRIPVDSRFDNRRDAIQAAAALVTQSLE